MAKLKSKEEALADLERNGGLKVIGPTSIDRTFVGYHRFIDANGGPYGSFEVFHAAEGELESAEDAGPHEGCAEFAAPQPVFAEPGFYWWSCHPGCLPDGEPNGPFPTAEGAYLDAIGE